ncbi:MAG: hypothetical protein KR126chlam4_00540 [Candidatus Anoxychlamydiales bacterium]|uniref:Uncharacterized protein n=1 Tax=marine sediment metagenome TaxID=412755 RepID=A0A0F9K1S7_9ZZZZ|nr:hypothetical protein [Candidatus Anoxychlamydiales bacterium]NGX40712.1 hypothetical protein [Candidatus Anoxychlamydiales bacterium]
MISFKNSIEIAIYVLLKTILSKKSNTILEQKMNKSMH